MEETNDLINETIIYKTLQVTKKSACTISQNRSRDLDVSIDNATTGH